ncbi:lauroyl-Kdo(2)-lipid IV(A) myristoyltransferase [Parashewanella tropica]|uniref:lauroyl-Kdo(2)-lipid IV(A) myristoyltransferase n=1 Tax=Parashewanella tropica TaxID=2547970 RepID=UPI00105957D1|nr:lauroyl-Kdo(2)-lipid IV(A) myristoyltransferase [Parashewanella tropica]
MSCKKNKYDCDFTWGLLHPKLWPSWIGIGILFLIGFLPATAREFIARSLCGLVYKISSKQVKICKANLNACFPQKSSDEIELLVRENIEYFLMTLLAQAELMLCNKDKLQKSVSLSGQQHIKKARDEGKPIIFISPHVWGLEHAGLRLSAELPMMAMTKAHRNPLFQWLTVKIRSSHGGHVYKREAGLRAMISALKEDRSFFYLPDEDLGPEKSVLAPFFNTTKATLPVVGRLAKAGDAVVLPVCVGYSKESHRFEVKVMEECDLDPIKCKQSEAQCLNDMIERSIMAHPEQYMWCLKVLKTRPEGEARLY